MEQSSFYSKKSYTHQAGVIAIISLLWIPFLFSSLSYAHLYWFWFLFASRVFLFSVCISAIVYIMLFRRKPIDNFEAFFFLLAMFFQSSHGILEGASSKDFYLFTSVLFLFSSMSWKGNYTRWIKYILIPSLVAMIVPLFFKDKSYFTSVGVFVDSFSLSVVFFILTLAVVRISIARYKLQEELINEKSNRLKLVEQELVSAKKKIEETSKFIAVAKTAQFMAHDVRRPFSQVKMVLSMFDSFASEPKKLERAKTGIEESIKNVEGMLADLIDSNKDVALKIRPCLLSSMVDKAVAQVPFDQQSIRIIKDVNPSFTLLCDEEKIVRCFVNIIENAVDAINSVDSTSNLKQKGEIRILSTKTGEIVISNNGPVVDEKDIPKLFDSFFTRDKKKGVGLGLAFVHRIISLHNGIVSVRNNSNDAGVEFSILLPQRMDVNLLVIDDEPFYREMVGVLVKENERQKQIRVFNASSVKEAVELTSKGKISHALVDLDLGKDIIGLGKNVTGFDYIEHVSDKNLNVVCALHTNRYMDDELKEKIAEHNIEYISKPLTAEKLYSFIYKTGGPNG